MQWKVLAMGNVLRKDDSIALEISDKVGAIKVGTNPENFITANDDIVIIDAVDFQGKPGDVKVFERCQIAEGITTTHNLSHLIINMARNIKVIGIQPKDTDYGEGLSPELRKKLPNIQKKVSKLLKSFV